MQKLFLLLTLPLLALTFNSCSSDDDGDETNYQQAIVGTWKMVEIINIETESPNIDWERTLTLKTAKFNADKTCTLTYLDGEYIYENGTYDISGKRLTMMFYIEIDDEYFTDNIDIISLNNQEGVFKMTSFFTVDSPNPVPMATETFTATLTVRAVKQ